MLLPNQKPTIPTMNFHDPWRNASSVARLGFPLITLLLVVLLLIIAMSTKVGPASANEAVLEDWASAPTTQYDFLDDVTLWFVTMTVGTFPATPSFTGYSSYHSVGTLDDAAVFVVDGQAYTINVLALSPFGNALGIRVSPDLDVADTSKWILLVDGTEFAFEDAAIGLGYATNETLVAWEESGLSWEDGQQVSLQLIEWEPGTCPVGEEVVPSILDAHGSE